MNLIKIFIVAFLASFIGSLQLGPVNLTVIKTSINKNVRAALWMSIGGALPEVIYAAIAVAFTTSLDPQSPFFFYAGVAMVPLLLILGTHKIIKSKSDIPNNDNHKNMPKSVKGDFILGFTLSTINPLLLPFWTTVLIYNANLKVFTLSENIDKIVFILGAAAGALMLLVSFSLIAHKHKHKINKIVGGNINKAIGIIFIVLAILQTIVVALRHQGLMY